MTDCHHTWIAGNTCDNDDNDNNGINNYIWHDNDTNDNDYNGIDNYIWHGMIMIFRVVLDPSAQ